MREFRVAVSDDWMDFARCKGAPVEMFFFDWGDEEDEFEAKKVCFLCPVSEPCLEMGMKMRHGIWGGLTAAERAMIREAE